MRRLILLHTTGSYAGIHQITGVEEGRALENHELPASIPTAAMLGGQEAVVVLSKVHPKYVIYRESNGSTDPVVYPESFIPFITLPGESAAPGVDSTVERCSSGDDD